MKTLEEIGFGKKVETAAPEEVEQEVEVKETPESSTEDDTGKEFIENKEKTQEQETQVGKIAEAGKEGETTGTKVDPTIGKGEQTPTTKPEEVAFDLSVFNKTYNTSFEKQEDIASLMEKSGKVGEYEKQIEELGGFKTKAEELEGQLKSTKEALDPLQYFANENEFKAQQLKMKYPDKNPYVIQKVVSSDLDKMNDMDVLAQKILLDNPNFIGGEAGARVHIEKSYLGEDQTMEEIDDFTKNKILIDANKARAEFKDFKQIELPKFPTAEEKQVAQEQEVQGLRDEWNPYMDKLTKPEALEISDKDGNKLFDFALTGDSTGELGEFFGAMIDTGGIRPNQEGLKIAFIERNKILLYKNHPQILDVYKNQLLSEFLKQSDKENANENPPNTSEATDEGVRDETGSGFAEFLGKTKSSGELF